MSTISELYTLYTQWKKSVIDEISQRTARAKENSHNTILETLDKRAFSQAKNIDKKIASSANLNLLEWVPFWVKDCFMVEWTNTTGGSKMLEHYKSPYTATAVQRLLDAWAILIAKENLDQFGHGSTGENSHFGPISNAHDKQSVSWGSSAWSAVNVADDITVFSLWEDTGGSIRQPAWYNKVVGFKPTYGKVSRNGVISYASSLDTVWPITKTVKDAAIVMNVIWWTWSESWSEGWSTSSPDAQDMTTTEYPQLDLESLEDIDLSKLTIGAYTSFLDYEGIDPTIKESTQNLLEYLKKQWATIESLDFFPGELLVSTYYVLAMAETASELARLDWIKYGHRSAEAKTRQDIYLKSRGEWFSQETKKRIVLWNQILSTGFENKYYHKALVAREKLRNHFKKDFDQVDFIISPVTPNTVPKLWESMNDPLAMYMSDLYTVWFSLGGLPTLSVPLWSPTGIQITGPLNDDHNVLRLWHHLEQTYPNQ